MASTNKTTYYELSQFLGTDKPAWLQDYNGDMSKIDAGIHTAQSAATGADGKADANATAIGTLSSLTTDAKTSAVAAINEVDVHADAAQSTANSVSAVASANTTAINGLTAYLNLQGTGSALTVTTNSGSITGSTVKSAKNSDGSLGKVYGKFIVNNPSATTTVLTIADTGLRPTENIDIDGLVTLVVYTATGINYVTTTPITIKTDGTCTISITGSSSIDHADVFMPPCLLFMQNFGD